jgi:general secretion pathway protein B
MSFILDALKKSEAERQRQLAPALLEIRVARPRRGLPTWALIVGVLLALNIVLLLAFVLRRAGPAAAWEGAAAQPPAAVSASGAAPAATPATPAATQGATQGATQAAPPATAATTQAGVAAAALPALPALPASTQGVNSSQIPAAANPQPGAAAAFDAQQGSLTQPSPADNPADDEPAVTPQRGSVKVQRGGAEDYSSLPSFSEIGGNVPDLRLDLHVYAERPADRYALINMHRVHEGDLLPEGARVIAITREGVALNFHGQDFMLRPQ